MYAILPDFPFTFRNADILPTDAGQAALPGGKSDTLTETPLQTARREAFEEIGLPLPSVPSTSTPTSSPSSHIIDAPDTPGLPYPFRLEHLCQLPTNLAKTELGVRPVVAYLYATSPVDRNSKPVDAAAALIPRLDAKEVAAVFSGPLHNFLKAKDELPLVKADGGVDGEWYKGTWIDWHETQFRMHNFYIPVKGQVVTRPRKHKEKPQLKASLTKAEISAYPLQSKPLDPPATSSELPPLYPPSTDSSPLPYRDHPDSDTPDPLDSLTRFRVFGMTARILVDCARVAYEEEPEFEHNMNFGDEAIIGRLIELGRLSGERGKGDEFEGDDLKRSLVSSRLNGRL